MHRNVLSFFAKSTTRDAFNVRSIHTTLCCSSKKESPLKALLDDAASFSDVKVDNTQQQWATLPYVDGTNIRKQGDYFRKPKQDPQDASIILFPGQGSQYVGMGRDLLKFPLAKELFNLANYILNYDLLKLCLEGPKEQLDQTKFCQPAVMVASLAALERLKEERPNAIDNCVATAGFSIGEITALVFAGALQFESALELVKVRAEAMQLASEVYKGGMARIYYSPDSKLNYALLKAREWATEKGAEMPECRIANYLFPHCKVVAGSEEALDFLEKNLNEFKLKKMKRLPVSGAFHTNLMQPAYQPFKKAVEKIEISDPMITVYSNVDGKQYRNAEHIRKQLPKQMVKPVKWEQLLHVVYERDQDTHFPRTFECGPGSMNAQRLEEDCSDYLAMLSPPDFEHLSSPHEYVNDEIHVRANPNLTPDYMCMKSSHMLSPRLAEDPDRKHKNSNEEAASGTELLPKLYTRSESECETPNFTGYPSSYSNPTDHISPSIKKTSVDIVKSADNYINISQSKSIKNDSGANNNASPNIKSNNYVNSSSKDRKRMKV